MLLISSTPVVIFQIGLFHSMCLCFGIGLTVVSDCLPMLDITKRRTGFNIFALDSHDIYETDVFTLAFVYSAVSAVLRSWLIPMMDGAWKQRNCTYNNLDFSSEYTLLSTQLIHYYY